MSLANEYANRSDLANPAAPSSSFSRLNMPSAALTSMPTASRRRRHRPPPLRLPSAPPTSLPSSFYECQPPQEAQQYQIPHSWRVHDRSAAASKQGATRRNNEDRVFRDADGRMFGVCDGHCGIEVSEMVSKQFPCLMAQGYSFKDAFARVDADVCSKVSKPFLGSTLTAVEVCRGKKLKVAHVGDSRAMLLDSMGRGVTLTRDHSPSRPDELRRIEMSGGGVLNDRVNGVLAVSRAIGDIGLKPVVTSEPEEREYPLNNNDQLLVVASDGLWDHISDSEVALYLRSLPLIAHSIAVPANLQAAANGLVELAVSRGSVDDVSVVLVDVRHTS